MQTNPTKIGFLFLTLINAIAAFGQDHKKLPEKKAEASILQANDAGKNTANETDTVKYESSSLETIKAFEARMPHLGNGWMSKGRAEAFDDFKKGKLKRPEEAAGSLKYSGFQGDMTKVREAISRLNILMKRMLERDRELKNAASKTTPLGIKNLKAELKKELSALCNPYADDVTVIFGVSASIAETEALRNNIAPDSLAFALILNRAVALQSYRHMMILLNISGVTYRPDLEKDTTDESFSVHSEFKKTFEVIKPSRK